MRKNYSKNLGGKVLSEHAHKVIVNIHHQIAKHMPHLKMQTTSIDKHYPCPYQFLPLILCGEETAPLLQLGQRAALQRSKSFCVQLGGH